MFGIQHRRLGNEEMGHFPTQKSARIKRVGYNTKINSILFYLEKLQEYDSNINPRKFQEILENIKPYIKNEEYENLIVYYRQA